MKLLAFLDEVHHNEARTSVSLAGAYLTLGVLVTLAAVNWITIPVWPLVFSVVPFACLILVATLAHRKYGARSRLYQLANFAESVSLLVGLIALMTMTSIDWSILWAFYLVMSFLFARGSGATPLGVLGVVLPPIVLAGAKASGAFALQGDWHVALGSGLLCLIVYIYTGQTRAREVAMAEHAQKTEQALLLTRVQLDTERKMRQLEDHWLTTLQQTASALFIVEQDDTLTKVGGGAYEDLLSSSNREFRLALHELFQRARNQNQVVSEFGLKLPDTERYVDLRVISLPGENNSRLVMLVQDVSERLELERKHQELLDKMALSDKMASLGVLSAGLAHEINNPLTYIAGNIEYVLGSKDLDEQFRAPLQDVQLGFRQIERILGDLKTFSHSPKKPSLEVVDLLDVCLRTQRLVATEIKYVSRFEVVLPERPLFIKGLADRIQQILLNLLINARQAMPTRPASENLIQLVLRREGADAFLEISDNGEGVPAEALRHIFDPFFTTKAPGIGTGLGLSISYQIAKEHGGQISVRSTRWKGTIFTLKLPLWEGSPDRHTILIIDDEERNLALFKRALRGFDVVTATGVATATRLLDTDFKAILSDVRLQDGNGFEIYEKAPPHLQERFLFLTALPPETAELSRRPSQCMILHKPVQLDELEMKLTEIVNRATAFTPIP